MKEPVKKTSLGSLQQWPHGGTDVAVLVTGRPLLQGTGTALARVPLSMVEDVTAWHSCLTQNFAGYRLEKETK